MMIKMKNSDIRKELKLKRNALTKEEVFSFSDKVLTNLLTIDFTGFKNFFIYKSFNNEVDTAKIIKHFLSENKVVSHPVIIGDNMLAGIPKSDSVYLSKFKTEEPSDYTEMKGVDVCLLPLLACDKNKNRLGYGKGYYDKFLSVHPCLKIGLAYDFQVVDSIESKPWDVPLDLIITETKIIK